MQGLYEGIDPSMNKIKSLILFLVLLVSPGISSALTLSDLRTQTRDLALDNGSRLRFSTVTVDTFINEGQRIAVSKTKAIIKGSQFELTVGATYYSLPSDYWQMRRLSLRNQDLEQESQDSLSSKVGLTWAESSGLPNSYFISFASRTKVGFYPFPNNSSSTGSVRYEYYAQATDLSATSDEPFAAINELEPFHHILAYYAAYKLCMIDGRQDLGVLYRTEFYEGLEQLKNEALARPSYRPSAMPINRTNRAGP